MRGKLQRKLNNKSGFTLAETLVALAISIILLAITMVGILQYYKNMKLTEMDMTAKEIFIAAQNHLTAADASGELKRYREKALDDSKTEVKKEALGTLIIEEPKDVPEGIVWPSPNEDYYYIEYNIPSGATGNLEGSILQYMLPFGAIDETVRADGKYIIEYNVKTATIYGVFYAAEDVDYNYADIIALNRAGGRADSADGRHTRRDYDAGVIGYYGGAMAGDLLSGETDELTLEIHNKDTLEVVIRDFNYFKKATDGTTSLYTHIVFTVEGKDSGNKEEFTLDLADSADPTKKDPSSQKWWTVKKEKTAGNKPIEYLEYTITLDDITRPGGHFADICPTLMPGEDIIVKAVSSSNSAAATVREATDMTNSLFEAVTNDSDPKVEESTASISHLRHFENLDNGVSKLPTERKAVSSGGKELYTPEYLVTKAVQTKDMDWNEFFGADDKKKSVYQAGLKENVVNPSKLANESFYGIKRDLLTEYEGNNFTISNVYIDNKNEDIDQDASTGNTKIIGAVNGALFRFCEKNIKISDLVLKDFDITTARNAAALVAEMQQPKGSQVTGLEISNVLVVGGKITSTYGRGNAGGLIGYTGATTTVTDCAANTKIVAKGPRLKIAYAGDAGGLIGEIKATDVSIRISNCYTGGQTVNGKYKSDKQTDYNVYGVDTAGGLIGKLNQGVNTVISNSYSTCSVYIADDENGIDYGCAGGLIGRQTNGHAKYTNCYATGLVDGDIGSRVGTFIGVSDSSDSFENCYVLDGISERPVSASNYTNISAINVQEYNFMPKNDGNVITHPTDKKLSKKMYPFVTVNSVGRLLTDDINATGVHYGDWQELETQNLIGDRSFAYREKIDGKDYWYIVTADEDEDGNTSFYVINTLKTAKDFKVGDKQYSYGILIPTAKDDGQLNGQFSEGSIKDYVGDKDPVDVEMADGSIVKCNFYPVAEDSKKMTRDDNTGIVKFLTWKKNGNHGKGDDVTYYFNPDFAAAISADDKDILGTSIRPYQVRTNKQLRNIASEDYLKSYSTCYYKQTLDIDLTKQDFKAFGGTGGDAFSGQYNAFYKNGQGYDINNFTQTIEKGSQSPGLIAEISVTAKISYVNLHGEIKVESNKCENVGSLSGQLRGGLSNCRSDVEIEIEIEEAYSGNIGGLIGTSVGGSKIDSCHYSGKEFKLELDKAKIVNVGGLVGDHSGKMLLCSSDISEMEIPETEIEEDEIDTTDLISIGGLLGKANILSNISESWSKISYKGDAEDMKTNAVIGGFVGRIFGGAKIKNCYAVFRTDQLEHGDSVNTGFKVPEDANLTIRGFAGLNEKLAEDSSAESVTYCHAVMLNEDGKKQPSTYQFIGGESLIEAAVCYLSSELNAISEEPGVKCIFNYHNLNNFTTNFVYGKDKNNKDLFVSGFSASIWEMRPGSDNLKRWPILINNREN